MMPSPMLMRPEVCFGLSRDDDLCLVRGLLVAENDSPWSDGVPDGMRSCDMTAAG